MRNQGELWKKQLNVDPRAGPMGPRNSTRLIIIIIIQPVPTTGSAASKVIFIALCAIFGLKICVGNEDLEAVETPGLTVIVSGEKTPTF